MSTRKELLAMADEILSANPVPKEPATRTRYRGGRPALNWLQKRDERGAAALWLIARKRLPAAANDNVPTAANDNRADATGLAVERRKDGRPRGRNADPRSLQAYLALPGNAPRLGDAPQTPVTYGGADLESRGLTIKRQRQPGDHGLSSFGRFTRCLPAIAPGAFFIGSVGGLGQPKMGMTRGEIRRAEEGTVALPPSEVDTVIETVLARGNVADVGKALGAKGGYADRRGAKALLDAARWAERAIAA